MKCDWPSEFTIAPETYEVRLLPGHSLESHFEAIKKDLTPFIEHVFDPPPHQVVYLATRFNEELLATIRSDSNIEYVACELIDEVFDPHIEVMDVVD